MKRATVLVVVLGLLGLLVSTVLAAPWIEGDISYIPIAKTSNTFQGYDIDVSVSGFSARFNAGFGFPVASNFDIDAYTGIEVTGVSVGVDLWDPYWGGSSEIGPFSFTTVGWGIGTDLRWQSGENFFKAGVEYVVPNIVLMKVGFRYEFSSPSLTPPSTSSTSSNK